MASHAPSIDLGFDTTKIEAISPVQSIVIPEIIVEDKTLNNLYTTLLSIVDDSTLSRSDKQSRLIDSIKQIPATHFYTVLTNITKWIDEKTLELNGSDSEQESVSDELQSLSELQQVVSLGITAQLTGLLTGKLIDEHNAINSTNSNLLKLRGKEFLVMLGVVLTAIAMMLAFQGYKSYQEELEQERQDALGQRVEFDRGTDILAELEL